MSTLMTYLTAFGLASGAGAKAFVPLLALGAFHYTDYFELAPRFEWIADPAVMIVLGVLVIAEILVDAIPELGEYSDTVAYLPKMAAGFIGFAAVTGTVDDSLTELVASGVLGGGTAVGVHWLRNKIRRPFRDFAEGVHEGTAKLASVGEAGVSATVAGTAVLVPPVSLLLLGGFATTAMVTARAIDGRRTPCVHCGEPIRLGALVCVHCKKEQT
jgi:hypothetical protein